MFGILINTFVNVPLQGQQSSEDMLVESDAIFHNDFRDSSPICANNGVDAGKQNRMLSY